VRCVLTLSHEEVIANERRATGGGDQKHKKHREEGDLEGKRDEIMNITSEACPSGGLKRKISLQEPGSQKGKMPRNPDR